MSEKLSIKIAKGFTKIYSFQNIDGKITIDFNKNKFITLNPNDKERFLQRQNATLFSFLSQLGYLSKLNIKNITTSLSTNLTNLGMKSSHHIEDCLVCSKNAEEKNKEDKFYLKNLVHSIQKFDLGITDINFSDIIKAVGSGRIISDIP